MEYPGHSPLMFAASLFASMFITLTAIAFVWEGVSNFMADKATRWHDPLSAHRYTVWAVMCGVVLLEAPDAVALLLAGEVTPGVERALDHATHICDVLAVVAFMAFAGVFVASRPVIKHQLTREPIPTDLWPTVGQLRKPMHVAMVIAFISIVVTLGK